MKHIYIQTTIDNYIYVIELITQTQYILIGYYDKNKIYHQYTTKMSIDKPIDTESCIVLTEEQVFVTLL
jgi:hypothetical protein